MGIVPAPSGSWGGGDRNAVGGGGGLPPQAGDFALPNLFVLRGLKNKPKFRCYASFTPKFSLLFQQVKGRVRRVFRALRSATGVSSPALEKLSRKFYQSFQKRVQLNPSNSDLSLYLIQ